MARQRGNTFSFLKGASKPDKFGVLPIKAEFGGSLPSSIYRVNSASSWSRWRRGFELATASYYQNTIDFPFTYKIPLPQGASPAAGNQPAIPGVFKGFPTKNKELGCHWAGVRVAGSLRFDNVLDHTGARASIASVTEDSEFYIVQLSGSWSATNPLPPPLFIPVAGIPEGLKPTIGEVIEDRIVEAEGVPINRDTIDPATQKRLGFIQAVIADINETTGVIKLKKRGSIEATPDRVLVTPTTKAPNVGRFFMTGTRYYCTCQDYTRRDYAYLSTLGKRNASNFPRTNDICRAPATSSTVPGTTRDNPGVYKDFSSVYIRSGSDPSLPGARSDGMPSFKDYQAKDNVITQLTDFWEPVLDEIRYCKHIYSMKFEEGLFPPEPSDFPVGMESMAEWEQTLVEKTRKDQETAMRDLMRYGLAHMDIPPFNCQSPMMVTMMQKLFNIPSNFVLLQNFTMFDKTGKAYTPSVGGKPAL